MPSAAFVVRRGKRPLSPPREFGFDPARRTRPRVEEAGTEERRVVVAAAAGGGKRGACEMAPALPDDMLLEVLRRLPPPRDVVRCAAVCRRWRRVVAGAAGCLPAPPRHFGFFRNYGPSPVPPFVPMTAGVDLGVGFLPVPRCGAVLVDARGRRLLLRELGPGHARELRLLVCDPLRRTSVRVPAPYIAGHRVACCALLPGEGAAFRVVVVLFGADPNHFEILVYSSASSAWEAATGPLHRHLKVVQGPTVVVGDVVYKLQCEEKYIMAVDAATMKLSAVPLPNAGMVVYTGNHWIGKTEDGRLCFFAIREQLSLVKWVLEAPGKWVPAQQPPVDLRALMRPALVGDLATMKLSAKMADQLRGCKLVSFGAFCEATGALFLVMADWVVALDLGTWRMERLWRNDDEMRPLGDVYPCEMLRWPPAIKGPGEA
ncbi:hypothetical protein ACP4OV_026554 [Aristida adscensionis]